MHQFVPRHTVVSSSSLRALRVLRGEYSPFSDFTGSLDQRGQAAAFGQNPKISINRWFIFGFLLHPLTQGRDLFFTTDGGVWESGIVRPFQGIFEMPRLAGGAVRR